MDINEDITKGCNVIDVDIHVDATYDVNRPLGSRQGDDSHHS